MVIVGGSVTSARKWARGGGGGNGRVGRAGGRRREHHVVLLHPLAVGHYLFRHTHDPAKDAVKQGQQNIKPMSIIQPI